MLRKTVPNIFEIEFVLNKYPFYKEMVEIAKAAGDTVKYSIILTEEAPAIFNIRSDFFNINCTPFN